MEILVHVSAPSSADDDARYHHQIAAILASFQPVSAAAADAADAPADTRSSRLETQSAVIPPADSPSRSDHDHHGAGPSPAPDPQRVCTLSTAIGPEALAPAPIDRLLPELESARPSPPQPQSLSQTQSKIQAQAQVHSESLVSDIPDSQPICQEQQLPRAPSDLVPIEPVPAAPIAVRPAADSADSPPRLPCKRRRLAPNFPANSHASTTAHDAPITSPSDRTHQNQTIYLRTSTTSSSTSTSPTSFLNALPIAIYPPPPPISASTFTTHITPTLSMLTERLNPTRTYKPRHQSRVLDNLERGYWALQITILPDQNQHPPNQPLRTWDLPSFHRFWTFLSDFIGKDARAGWGVWCIVEEIVNTPNLNTNTGVNAQLPSTASTDPNDPDPDPDPNPDANPNPNLPAMTNTHSTPGSLSVSLKMYTWGEVAMHTYLLLFLASERRVRGMGAEWRDSGEEVVIQM